MRRNLASQLPSLPGFAFIVLGGLIIGSYADIEVPITSKLSQIEQAVHTQDEILKTQQVALQNHEHDIRELQRKVLTSSGGIND